MGLAAIRENPIQSSSFGKRALIHAPNPSHKDSVKLSTVIIEAIYSVAVRLIISKLGTFTIREELYLFLEIT